MKYKRTKSDEMGKNASEGNALLEKNVVIVLRNGVKKLGTLKGVDPVWITIEFQGERQLIPLENIDVMKEAV